MKIELNIGLPDGYTFAQLQQASELMGNPANARLAPVAGRSRNKTVIVVELDTDLLGFTPRSAELGIEYLCFDLVHLLGQDCVAVNIPSMSIGRRIGPRSWKHEDFDISKFIRPVAEVQQPAK